MFKFNSLILSNINIYLEYSINRLKLLKKFTFNEEIAQKHTHKCLRVG